jgi:hypothetical protein
MGCRCYESYKLKLMNLLEFYYESRKRDKVLCTSVGTSEPLRGLRSVPLRG